VFPVYAAIRELSREGIANIIDRCCAHAAMLANGIAALVRANLSPPDHQSGTGTVPIAEGRRQ